MFNFNVKSTKSIGGVCPEVVISWLVCCRKPQRYQTAAGTWLLSAVSAKILQIQFKFWLDSSVMKVFRGHFCCWLEARRFSGTLWSRSAQLDSTWANMLIRERNDVKYLTHFAQCAHQQWTKTDKMFFFFALFLFLNLHQPLRIRMSQKMSSNSVSITQKYSTALHVYPHSEYFCTGLNINRSSLCQEKCKCCTLSQQQSIKLQLIGPPRASVTGPTTGLYTAEKYEKIDRIRLKYDCQKNMTPRIWGEKSMRSAVKQLHNIQNHRAERL